MMILMVDDGEINLGVYRGALKKVSGAECVGFTSSADALAWTRTNTPDVVLLDFNMPSPNGLEFIEAFRSDPKHEGVPVIMITGETERHIRYRALELGAADFLTKPVDLIEFRARMQNMLALADSRKKLANRAEWLAFEVRRATERIVAREKETIVRLMRAAEFRDNETGAHILRMGLISSIIGGHAGLSEAECEMLQMAAPMHDIGKVATPDAILLKPGKLTPDEWEIMKRHTIAGHEILKESDSELLRLAALIALSHHEKFDGSGYPYGTKGEKIPLVGRICAIADVFDALTSVRSYKDAWPLDRTLAELESGSGTHFDPELLAAFHRGLPEIVQVKERYPDELVPAAG